MSLFVILIAGIAYFALGGLWFTQIFGIQWDQTVGFSRPAKCRPPSICYLGSRLGCLVAAVATTSLFDPIKPASLLEALQMGVIVGAGYGIAITGINAIPPIMSKPGSYIVVVGSYHLVGLVLCTALLYGLE